MAGERFGQAITNNKYFSSPVLQIHNFKYYYTKLLKFFDFVSNIILHFYLVAI